MNARDLFQAGRLDEAVQALSAELRNDPSDARRRTFLFELLCFAGQYDRAEKQLDILADTSSEAGMGSLVYRSALQAERLRQEMFEKKTFPGSGAPDRPVDSKSGTLNGQAFESLTDADPRVGARLEVFAAGAYLWLPFEHISSIEIQPPKRLRDLIWIPALLKTGPACKGMELGEVLLPALTPFAWRNPDDTVRLGRTTNWEEIEGEVVPAGQKMLLVDDEEIPILDVRKVEFASPAATAS